MNSLRFARWYQFEVCFVFGPTDASCKLRRAHFSPLPMIGQARDRRDVMQLHAMFKLCFAAALVSLAVFVASGQGSAAQDAVAPPANALPPNPPAPNPPPPNTLPDALPAGGTDPEGVETLTRGPVHEAFAAPTASDPKPGAVVPKKPPADIDEEPPELRPEGAIWINGYWEWDAETEDFLWISGLWRVPPPEMRWVPPYWTEADGGWQRVPGFWTSTAATELEYRPTPPDSLEVGPTSPAPAENYFYIPGSWTYYDTGYRWRGGYWCPYREDWVWCPARWIWTPAGCIYQAGYWDYRPYERAQLYAPVRFTSPIYLTSGYRYRPWCVLDSSRFFVHLWIGPRSNCYYFGNYYGSYGSRFGYTPWCDWSYRNRRCYDPLWSWSHTHYRRQGVDYIGRCRGWHQHYDKHEHDRPARTWNDQVRQIADHKLDPRKSQRVLAADLKDVAKRDDLPLKLTRLSDNDRQSVRQVSDDLRKLNVERHKVEREALVARGRTDTDRDASRGKAGADKPGESKPNSAKVTARLDEVAKELDRGKGDAKRTARMALPEQSEAVRAVTRAARSPRETRGGSDNNAATTAAAKGKSRGNNDNSPRPRIDSDRGATVGNDTPSVNRDAGGDRGSTRSKAAASLSKSKGPDLNPPKIDLPATDRPATERPAARADAGRGRDSDRPNPAARAKTAVENAPRSSTPPRIEARSTPKIEGPKIEGPKTISPRSEAPRIETRGRGSDNRDSGPANRSSQPRVTAPPASGPRLEAPRPSAPRVEPRSAPRIESTPRPAPRSTPRIEAPRSSPRIEAPRASSPARSMQRAPSVRSAPSGNSGRAMSRPSGSSNRGGGASSARSSGGNRSRGRDRD
jgi:hypothetical protein